MRPLRWNNSVTIVFNLNLLQCDENTSWFLGSDAIKSFVPTITKPTRITEYSATFIDNIFVSGTPTVKSGVIVTDISDHFPIYTVISNVISHSNPNTNKCSGIRYLSEPDLRRLKEALTITDWYAVYNCDDVDTSFDNFMEILMVTLNSLPTRQQNCSNYKKHPRLAWISKSLLKSINRKNTLYYKYKNNHTVKSKLKYSRYLHILTTSLRLAKKNYFTKQFNVNKGDIKKTLGGW